LSKQLINNIESIQKRAIKIIKPSCSYAVALRDQQLEFLEQRRENICLSFFKELENPSDLFHNLSTPVSENKFNLWKKYHPTRLIVGKQFYTMVCQKSSSAIVNIDVQ
jgi:hypothetical protein